MHTIKRGTEDIEIHLEARGKEFVILARFAGGGLVNGYTYCLDNVASIPLQMALALPAIKRLVEVAAGDVLFRTWESYVEACEAIAAEAAAKPSK